MTKLHLEKILSSDFEIKSLLAKMMDLANSLLVPNHQNPGSELESSKPVRVACLVW